MPFLMSPVAALNQLISLDRRVALPLVAGIAVMASAVIVMSFGIAPGAMMLIGLYVIGLGLLLSIVAAVIRQPWLQQALGAVLVLLIVAIATAFFVSAVFRPAGMSPPWCMAKFWLPCAYVEQQILRENASAVTERVDVPQVIQAVPRQGEQATTAGPGFPVYPRVSIKFAGLITRDSIVELNRSLQRGGWKLEGDSGERTPAAAGLNEVRYSAPGDRQSAEALAQAVSDTDISARTVKPRQDGSIAGGALELWISN